MGVELDKFFETVRQLKAEEQHKNEIWEKTWHVEYCLFSFNKDMFGFVHHRWYPCGSWEAPNSEYDYDYEKGFRLYDKDYRTNVIDEERSGAEFDRDHNVKGEMDWKFVLNIKCIPVLVYKEEQVGYIDGNGDKHYFDKYHPW